MDFLTCPRKNEQRLEMRLASGTTVEASAIYRRKKETELIKKQEEDNLPGPWPHSWMTRAGSLSFEWEPWSQEEREEHNENLIEKHQDRELSISSIV
jgi:hypothetical protein